MFLGFLVFIVSAVSAEANMRDTGLNRAGAFLSGYSGRTIFETPEVPLRLLCPGEIPYLGEGGLRNDNGNSHHPHCTGSKSSPKKAKNLTAWQRSRFSEEAAKAIQNASPSQQVLFLFNSILPNSPEIVFSVVRKGTSEFPLMWSGGDIFLPVWSLKHLIPDTLLSSPDYEAAGLSYGTFTKQVIRALNEAGLSCGLLFQQNQTILFRDMEQFQADITTMYRR